MDTSGKSKGITFSQDDEFIDRQNNDKGAHQDDKSARLRDDDVDQMMADVWTQSQIDLVLSNLSILSSDNEYSPNLIFEDEDFIPRVRSFIGLHPVLDPFDSKSLFLTMMPRTASLQLARHLRLYKHIKRDESGLYSLALQDPVKFKELFTSCWNNEIGSLRANPWILQIHNDIHFTQFLESQNQETISPMITTLDGLFDYMTVTPKAPSYMNSKTEIISAALTNLKRDPSIEPLFGRDLLESLLWVYLSPEQRQVVSQRHFFVSSDFALHWNSFVSAQMQMKLPNALVLVTISSTNGKHVMALFCCKEKYYLFHYESSLAPEFHVNNLIVYHIPLITGGPRPSEYVYELIALMYCHMHFIQGWGLDSNNKGVIQVVIPRSIITRSTDIMSHMWLSFVTHAGSYHNMDKPIRLMFDLSYYYRIHQSNYDAYYTDLHGVHKVPFETFVNDAKQDDVTQKIMDHHAHKISILFKNTPDPYIVRDEPSIVPGNSCLAVLMYLILKTDIETLLSWIPEE